MHSEKENICIQCGMCCDGTLFNHGHIDPDEVIDTRFDFEIFENEKSQKLFKQECCYLSNKGCTIYNKRPYRVCSTFQCKQLKEYLSDKTSYQDAIKNINNTKALKNNIKNILLTEFPKVNDRTIKLMIRNFERIYLNEENQKEFRKKYINLFLDIGKFNFMKEKYFHSSPDENI